jgi:hypothetical protein
MNATMKPNPNKRLAVCALRLVLVVKLLVSDNGTNIKVMPALSNDIPMAIGTHISTVYENETLIALPSNSTRYRWILLVVQGSGLVDTWRSPTIFAFLIFNIKI